MHYPYCDKDLLNEKETYQYSKYYGADFIDSFFNLRLNVINSLKSNDIDLKKLNLKSNTYNFLLNFLNNQKEFDKFALLLKKFEVTKRIFENTDENFKKLENSKSENLNLYILFSNCCYLAYKKNKHLSFVNAVLKCNDIICSQKDFSLCDINMLKTALQNELKMITELKNDIL